MNAEAEALLAKGPCVVFASHASLRVGDAVQVLQKWRHRSQNLLLLLDSSLASPRVVAHPVPVLRLTELLTAPFMPLSTRVICAPLDVGLSLPQLHELLAVLQPHALVVPRDYQLDSAPPTCLDACSLLILYCAPVLTRILLVFFLLMQSTSRQRTY